VDRTGSGSRPMTCFGISGVELSGSATRHFVRCYRNRLSGWEADGTESGLYLRKSTSCEALHFAVFSRDNGLH
jgi:hypothetical protein